MITAFCYYKNDTNKNALQMCNSTMYTLSMTFDNYTDYIYHIYQHLGYDSMYDTVHDTFNGNKKYLILLEFIKNNPNESTFPTSDLTILTNLLIVTFGIRDAYASAFETDYVKTKTDVEIRTQHVDENMQLLIEFYKKNEDMKLSWLKADLLQLVIN